MVRLPNVPLLPPILVGPLTRIAPLPVWIALLLRAPVTVIVLPPSFSVPEVRVRPTGVPATLGNPEPTSVRVPALLFITTLFRFEIVPLLVQLCAPDPLKVMVFVPGVNVVDASTVKFP